MYIVWPRRQLITNIQRSELVCPHLEIARPWTIRPILKHKEGGKISTIWRPGPSIRECCVNRKTGLALAAWWWDAKRRFQELYLVGLEDGDVTEALVEQLPDIEDFLEERIPKPTVKDWDRYERYRESLNLSTSITPECFIKLGLEWPCSEAEVDKKWKSLASLHHPDRGGNPQTFHRYNKAYLQAKKAFQKDSPCLVV